MLKPEAVNSRLRDVVDFEVDYIRRSLEQEVIERDKTIFEMDKTISEKDDEIGRLKAKLKENGIEY